MTRLVGLRSHAQIAPFRLHQPGSVAVALALHAAHPGAGFMAGGLDLIGRMKWGEAVPDVVHLGGIAGLAEIAWDGTALRIGAGATHAAIIDSPAIAALLPDLAALWPLVANPRIRFAGTLGGNLMAGQAGYDGMPALLALGATLECATPAGTLHVAAGQPLPAGALLTAALLPAGTRLLADRSLKPAILAWLGLSVAEGRVTAARLGLGAAHASAVGLDLPLVGTTLSALGGVAAEIGTWVATAVPEPVGDSIASASYRRRMAGVLARRLLIRAGAREEG